VWECLKAIDTRREILAARDRKLEEAREQRKKRRQQAAA
jgi:hypothetical protein